MKWFLIGFVCVASATIARGDAATDYTTGRDAFDNQRYDEAIKAFDDILKNYPTFQSVDDVTLLDGQAYLYAGKFPDAVKVLAKLLSNKNKAAYRTQALYWTALAQFSDGSYSQHIWRGCRILYRTSRIAGGSDASHTQSLGAQDLLLQRFGRLGSTKA